MKEQPERPDWWPRDSETYAPLPLLLICHYIADSIKTNGQEMSYYGRCINPTRTDRIAKWTACLSHACDNWAEPSTNYENALRILCLAAVNEANNHAARAAAKETK